jgi:transcriptional regulator with XRE-family HTH domain
VDRPKPDKVAVGRRIVDARERLGANRHAFAASIGKSWGHLQRWEEGETLLDTASLALVAEALGVTSDWLLWGDATPGEQSTPKADRPQYPAAFAKMQELLPAYLADHGHAPPSPEEWAVLATQPFSTPAGEEPGVRNFFHALMSHRIRDPERIAEGKRVSAEDERGRVASGMGTRKAKR